MHIKELRNQKQNQKYLFCAVENEVDACPCLFCALLLLILNGWCIPSAPQSGMLKCSSFISGSILACDHFILAH